VSNERTALRQRWSALTAAQRALLVRRLDAEGNNAEPTGAARASIRKEPPPLVEVDATGRRVAVYPASIGQQRLWFLDQLDRTAGAAYHLAAGLQLRGRLDRGALRATLDAIVARHEVLRTSFVLLDEQPVQRIAPAEVGFHLIEHDLSGLPGAAQQQRVNELSGSEATERFDLSTGPLIRGQLLRLGPEEHLLLITQHHIISDGWSIGVMVREVAALYGAFSQGQPNPLPALPIQYADYAVWQRQWLQAEVLHEQVGFWRAHLAGAPGLLELPNDRPRPAVQSYAGGRVRLTLSGRLTTELRRLSQRHGVTLFMSLLTGWAVLLSRLSGQSDVVIGVPVANRQRRELESLLGFFANTLALRVRLEDDPSVTGLLARTRASTLEAYAHQDLPFAQLVEALQPVRSLGHNPIFQVMLAFDNAPGERALSLPGLQVSEFKPPRSSAMFDLTLGLRDVGDRIEGVLEYASDLFERASIERMAGHLRTVFESMVADDQQRISAVNLLSQSEREQLLVGFNQTQRPYPSKRCTHELFEEQVERTPQALALVCEDRQFSYGELNAHANRVAHHLIALGLRPDDRVALCMQRSPEMVVGLLGILKAGGAYVPLDPGDPQERLAFMLKDSAPVALLTQAAARAGLPALDVPVVLLDLHNTASIITQEPEHNPDASALGLCSSHLAYVIYTSGSTGLPKAAMNTHGGIANRLLWMQEAFALDARDRVLQKTPFTFDVSVWEFFWPLITGGQLVVARPGGHRDNAYLMDVIQAQGITTIHFVPPMLQVFLDALEATKVRSLRHVICSGQELPASLTRLFFEVLPKVQLHNLYGPTEAAVDVTRYSCFPADPSLRIPIGRPIANTQIYILDALSEPVPIGVVGEIHIGGSGVGRGYLNRAQLTVERFVADPFNAEPTARMYRTGDLGRWRSDGNIEFLGRNDLQVKIRGFRIELGEIEAQLARHPAVREVVVLAREQGGDKQLVAYYSAAPGAEPPGLDALRRHLSASLPEYMLPGAYVLLEAFPLTSNGKLDRRALPLPGVAAYVARGYEAPEGEIEPRLARIWAELLQLERVGREDNFFELGGHSLAALRLIARVASTFGVRIGVAALFAAPTLRQFALRVCELEKPLEPWNVVPIQLRGENTPIIAINNAMMYYKLAQSIGTDRKFFAVQLYDPINPKPLPSRTLEQITTDYVNLIRAAQPHGPYILIGLCVAGLIAYEAARQLRQAGEQVPLVVMADTWPPCYRVRPPSLRGIVFNLRRNFLLRRHTLTRIRAMRTEELIASSRLAKWNRLIRLSTALRLIQDPAEFTALSHQDRWFLPTFNSARKDYRAPVASGDVVLLESSMLPVTRQRDPKMGWSNLVQGQLLHYRLPAWHDFMFRDERAVAKIAAILQPLLIQIDARERNC
jgi:amino acid adenylation domain-containing protein